ncbi:MAG: radical SAM family heme chaperone HemW [Chitinophagaceae bacterium]|nr:radical SAM family heme chaperone HemW [Chitinophagaceae bacterium]
MAGIYVHIPFCKKACIYCDFHFTTSFRFKQKVIQCIQKELQLRRNYLGSPQIQTIYFGGGTPSVLRFDELRALIDCIQDLFKLDPDAEITLEANPDDITDENLKCWNDVGINRISIGIQSFFDEDLIWMNRAHSALQAKSALEKAKLFFHNITADLIYGYPLLTDEKWKKNLEMIRSYGIPHVSCYALTVEDKTKLFRLIREKKTEEINDKQAAAQYLYLMDFMDNAGYEHYEISSFAKPGYRSRHNSSYWSAEAYLGVGPSAHSFNGTERQWNISNNMKYIQALEKNIIPCQKEILSPTQQLNEYILTALRTREGIHVDYVEKKFQILREVLYQKAEKYLQNGMMAADEGFVYLTQKGKLFADRITTDLFF